jgi:cation-transporting ATPase 13A3/4/5
MFLDSITIPISWALTNAYPAKSLITTRPTARVLGIETIISVTGPIVINVLIALFSVVMLQSEKFYNCNVFNGRVMDLRLYWEFADNYVGSVTSIMIMYNVIHSALAFNISCKYRTGGFRNIKFAVLYTFLFTIITTILLADPNPLGCLFKTNCGTPNALIELGYSVPFNAPNNYFSKTGHNVIPIYFRYQLFALSLFNLFLVYVWEHVFILGICREKALKYFSSKQKVKNFKL